MIPAEQFPSAADLGIMEGSPPPMMRRVTLENWQRPPWNRWSYLHIRELIPTASIRARRPSQFDTGAAGGLDQAQMRVRGLAATTLAEVLDHSWTDALVVLHRGRLVHEAYRDPMRPETRHLSMSVGKSITSLIVGAMIGLGEFGDDTLITDVIPELAVSGFRGACVQHLLDMSVAPIEFPTVHTRAGALWDIAAGWAPYRRGLPETIFELLNRSYSTAVHGQLTLYEDLCTNVLGLIAERVSGMRFADLASDLLWTPGGMEFDADLTIDRAGTAAVDGGYCIAARDFARLGQLVVTGGAANGAQVIPESWIAEYSRHRATTFDGRSYGANWPGAAYHNQWWQMDDRLFAVGVHGQMIAVDPASETVVVFLSSAPDSDDVAVLGVQRDIVKFVIDALN